MLLINGENLKLPTHMLDELKRIYGLDKGEKGIIRLYIDARHKRQSKTDPRRTLKPASFLIPSKESDVLAPLPKTGKSGNQWAEDMPSEVIYFTGTKPHPDIKGESLYLPAKIEITDGMVIYNNMTARPDTGDLLYFLHYCSRQNRTGTSFDPNSSSVFYISNPAQEAKEQVNAKRELSKISAYLYDDSKALQPSQYVEIAGVFGILGAGSMSVDQVKLALESKMNEKHEGASHRKLFLEIAEGYGKKGSGMVDKSMNARKYVTACIDGNVIGLDIDHGQWRWRTDDGSFANPIVIVKNLLDESAAAKELADYIVTARGEFDFDKMKDAYEKMTAVE